MVYLKQRIIAFIERYHLYTQPPDSFCKIYLFSLDRSYICSLLHPNFPYLQTNNQFTPHSSSISFVPSFPSLASHLPCLLFPHEHASRSNHRIDFSLQHLIDDRLHRALHSSLCLRPDRQLYKAAPSLPYPQSPSRSSPRTSPACPPPSAPETRTLPPVRGKPATRKLDRIPSQTEQLRRDSDTSGSFASVLWLDSAHSPQPFSLCARTRS